MALEQVTLVTIATCDLCAHHKATHASTPEQPNAKEYFTSLGWEIVEEVAADLAKLLAPGDIPVAFCPYCVPLIRTIQATAIT